jgi:Baseplate J-like protein
LQKIRAGEGELMAEEQATYLISQDEELTNVRERLEQAPAHSITLVIPSHTKLRSHIGWRVLRARARELDKDVLVISPDRQIRAVAKAAGFRVAESLESPASQTRPTSHPGRTGGSGSGGRPISRTRTPTTKGTPDSRFGRRPDASPRRNVPASDSQLRQGRQEPISQMSPVEPGTNPSSPIFDPYEKQYGQDFEPLIDTAPSVRPLMPQPDDEEPDLLLDDISMAQRIRDAAQQGEIQPAVPPSVSSAPPVTPEALMQTRPGSSHSTYAPNEPDDDPLAYLEDLPPRPLPEQHGSISIDDVDAGVDDISERPTDGMTDGVIEDLGDEGDFVLHPNSAPATWPEDDLEEPGISEPPRVQGVRPRRSLQGSMPVDELEDEDTRLPLPDQATRVTPSPAVRSSGTAVPATPAASTRGPQPIIPPKPRSGTGTIRPPTAQTNKPLAGTRTTGRSATIPPTVRATSQKPPAPGSDRRRTVLVVGIIVLLFLMLAVFAYYLPSANVTITVPSQSFSMNRLKFTATDKTIEDVRLSALPAEILTFSTTTSGSTKATGSQQVGTVAATGSVTFTNKNQQPIVIPTDTILATAGGIQFITDAEIQVPSNSTFPAVTIHAQNPGQAGNVPANTITVIPLSSIAAIEQDQFNSGITIAPGTLTVTNPDATTGGGAGNQAVVSSNDVATLKKQLEQQLQPQVQAWLKKQVHDGDVVGQLPHPVDNITTTPSLGQAVSNGSITGKLTYKLNVLVVRAATIQSALSAKLNAQAAKEHPGYALVPQQPVKINALHNTSPADGKSVSFSVDATGQIAPQVSTQKLASLLARQSVDDAKRGIKNGTLGDLHNVQNVTINMSPGFLPWLPFRADNIHIFFKAIPTSPVPKKK